MATQHLVSSIPGSAQNVLSVTKTPFAGAYFPPFFLTSAGFRMLEAFNITDRTFAGMNGVSMEPGSFNSYIAYRLHKDSFINQPTK